MHCQPRALSGRPKLPPRLQNAGDRRDTIPEDGDQRRDSAPRGQSSEKRPLEKNVPSLATARPNTRHPPPSNRFSAPQIPSYYDPNPAHPDSTPQHNNFRNTTQPSRRDSAPAGNGFDSYPADDRLLRMIELWNSARMVNSTIYTPLLMNPQSVSHPSSQQYLSNPQDAEHWRNTGPYAINSTPFANGWGNGGEPTPQECYNGAVPLPQEIRQTPLEYHNSVIPQPRGGEQTSRGYFNSAIPQRRATTGNNNFYRPPMAQRPQDSPDNNRRHTESEIPRMPQEDLQGSQYVDAATFSKSIPARTRSYPRTTSRLTSDQQHSIHNYQPMQYPPEYYQDFDLQTGMITLGIHESDWEAYDVAGNETWRDGNERDGQSVASRTTDNSESTDSIDITYSSPASDDDGSSSRRMSSEPANRVDDSVIPADMDPRRSQQRYEDQGRPDDTNAFACEVNVWPNDPNGYEVESVTLKFDTQCQQSNWVSAKIVDKLEVTPIPLDPGQNTEFVTANGQSITASGKTTLWFESSQRGTPICAEFLVSPVRDAPYELLLGGDDCLRLGIIQRPSLPGFLALVPRRLNPNEKEEETQRGAQHAIKAQQRSRLIQKERAMQRQQEQASRTTGPSQSNRRDNNHHNNMQAQYLKEDGIM